MDEHLAWRMFRVNDDAVTRVSGVGARDLEALDAVRAPDQHGLPVAKLVESLEEVNATQGYPLYHTAVAAPERHPTQPREHGHPGLGTKAG